MKRPDLLTASTLAAALLWAGPAFSADSTGTAAPNATRETSAAPANKPSTFAMPHSLTGSDKDHSVIAWALREGLRPRGPRPSTPHF